MNKAIAPILTVALALGVGFLIYTSVKDRFAQPVVVRGVIGSEKEALFKDPEMVALLKRKGFTVQTDNAGSRQIATLDLKSYDFAFPAGVPAAEKLRRDKGIKRSFDVFFTPMAIASWKPLVSILEQNGLATNKGAYSLMPLDKFLELAAKNTRWVDLKKNSSFAVKKPLLINTTDPRRSNSAAMFIALTSYVLNGDNVVQSAAQGQKVLPALEPLFLKQGFQESSSQGPFENYFLLGAGAAPLVFIYESQFLEKLALKQTRPDMRLIYPQPNVFTKHVLLPLSDNGARLGELLSSDPEVQKLEVKYGYRTNNPQLFTDFVKTLGYSPPDQLEVIETPRYEVLESMIGSIEKKY